MKLAPALVLAFALAGCCPEVRAVDGAAAAAGDGGATGTGASTLSAIQTDILDRHCVTDCHDLGKASAGLRLDRGKTHAALVQRASAQIKSAVLVAPGDPDRSYLMRKLGGAGIVGTRMPRLAPPLTAAQVARLRAWITRGAPND